MKNIKEWAMNNNVLQRTEDLFWTCFQSYREEEPEEFVEVFPEDKTNVKTEFIKIVHEVILPDFEQEVISVYLNIYVGDHNVGWFKNVFCLDGTEFDEFFVIE